MPTETATKRPEKSLSRQIELRGVRVHNLKNLDLDIPLGCLVAISGVSGSGKSSLAFDTLYAEGQRRYIESFSIAARQHLERIDRPDADCITHVPPTIAIRSATGRRGSVDARSTVATVADLHDGFRMLFSRIGCIICPACNLEVQSHSAADVVHAISELPEGTRCQIAFAVLDHPEADAGSAWLARGFARAIWDRVTHDLGTKPTWPNSEEVLLVVDRLVAGKTSPERLLESAEVAMREGGGQCLLLVDSSRIEKETKNCREFDGQLWHAIQFNRRLICSNCSREFLPRDPRLFSHLSEGACLRCRGTGRRIDDQSTDLKVKSRGDDSTAIERVTDGRLDVTKCLACDGTRFRDETRAVKIASRSIADVCGMSPAKANEFVRELSDSLTVNENQQTELIRKDITDRLSAVCDLGLDYFTLDRAAETLSGGEMRRLLLAALIGSRVTGTLVVVDEPAAGLSESELPLVTNGLRRLLSLRNSVIAVEHSPPVVSAADHIIEIGPGAGPSGGNIVFQGSPAIWPGHRRSGQEKTQNGSVHTRDRSTGARLKLTNIQHPNLKIGDAEFPLGQLTIVAGPSGSGKTTLLTRVLYPAIRRHLGLWVDGSNSRTCDLSGAEGFVDAILVDQAPLTKSARSNPATWLDVFDDIRQTFAATAEAKQRGYTARHFSFNSTAGGRCRSCLGTGLLKHDMQFLPDVTLVCPECHGSRFRREILEVKYRGRSIADVLAMSVSEAEAFFRSQPRVQYRFQMLKQIGLDYLVLGQPSETLSGGEAQRLKLAARLAVPSRGPCLIVCDEPTNGLHPVDVVRLIETFRELIANGNTIVLADNNPELLDAAGGVIELRR